MEQFEKKVVQMTYSWNYGKPKWSTQKDEEYIKEAYNKIVWAYACVIMISSATASVPWVLYRSQRNKLIEIDEHPILDLVNKNANPNMTSRDFFDLWATFLALQGKFYAEKNNPVIPTQLFPMYPHLTRPIPDLQNYISGYEYDIGGSVKTYKRDSVLWSKFNDPLDFYEGLSPVRAMARTIDTENEAVKWNKSMLQNSAVPPGAISAVNVNPTVIEKLKEEWRSRYGGSSNSRVPLIFDAEKISYTNFGLNPIDMDFLNQRKLNRIEICAGFGVPGQIIGDPEGQTYANYEQANKAFWENTVITRYLDPIKDKLNAEVCLKYNENLVLNYNLDGISALHEALDSISERIMGLFEKNIITQNEGRESIGYEKLPDGDIFSYQIAGKMMESLDIPDKEETDTENENVDENDNSKKKELKSIKISRSKRTEYLNAQEIERNKFIIRAEKRIKTLFVNERKALKIVYSEVNDVKKMYKAAQNVIKANKKNWIVSLTAIHIAVTDFFGKRVFSELTKTKKELNEISDNKSLQIKIAEYSVYDTAVMTYIRDNVGENVKSINETTLHKIKMRIDEGITHGLPIDKIASMIDRLYLDQIIPNRSTVIAQTEVIGAANHGSYSAALQSGVDTLKFWIYSFDDRTRPTHLAMGNHPSIELKERFHVGNSLMLFPHDGAGEPQEVIRCRCTIGYERK